MKFIADCHLGKIAKYLRIFGFDTLSLTNACPFAGSDLSLEVPDCSALLFPPEQAANISTTEKINREFNILFMIQYLWCLIN